MMRNKKIKLYFGKPIEFTWIGRTMTGKYDRQWRKIYQRIAHEMRRFKHKRYKRMLNKYERYISQSEMLDLVNYINLRRK